MPNDALRRAMAEARLTERDLADRVGSDLKTVQRWVSDEGRTPHPRLRWAVADALGTDEQMLWPQVRAALKTGPDREIVSVYPSGAGMPREVRQRLVTDATHELVFCGYTLYRLWLDIPGFSDLLRAKAAAGVRIRFVVGDPAAEICRRTEQIESTPMTISMRLGHALRELEPLTGSGVQVRQTELVWGRGIHRGDEQATLSLAVLGLMGGESPHIHLRRRQSGGLFDQMAGHAEALWEAATPVWP